MMRNKTTLQQLSRVLAAFAAAAALVLVLPSGALADDVQVVAEQQETVVTVPNGTIDPQPSNDADGMGQAQQSAEPTGLDESAPEPMEPAVVAQGADGVSEVEVTEDGSGTSESGADAATALATQATSPNVAEELHVAYTGHVQKKGWQDWVRDGITAGTYGESLRVEAMRIRLEDRPSPASATRHMCSVSVGRTG